MILIDKNFLQNEQIDSLLKEISECKFDNKNQPPHWVNSIKRIQFKNKTIHNKLTKYLKTEIEQFFDVKINKQHNLHAVVWPEGKSMPLHKDYGALHEFPERDYTSIIYLNNNYLGGELIIPSLGLEISPSSGMLVCFKGGDTQHSVKKIIQNTRYTIICWWEIIRETTHEPSRCY